MEPTADERAAALFEAAQKAADAAGFDWETEDVLPGPVDEDRPELVESGRHWRAARRPRPDEAEESVAAIGQALVDAGMTVAVAEDDGHTTLRAQSEHGLVRFVAGPGGCALVATTVPAPRG